MQRAKHADRKRRTRARILIGAAAERAGAADLVPDEIEAVLTHYVRTGGEPDLRAYVAMRRNGNTNDPAASLEGTEVGSEDITRESPESDGIR